MNTHETKGEGPLGASVDKLRQEMERWIDMVRSSGSRAWETLKPRGTDRRFVPAADMVETPEDFRVLMDIPGVDARTLEVNLTGNMLTVKGIKAPTPAGENHMSHLDERPIGSFTRSLPMPAPVNTDQVSADVRDGVLTIVLMKSERAKPHQIRVSVSGSTGENVPFS
jgi:HSP20 family protein